MKRILLFAVMAALVMGLTACSATGPDERATESTADNASTANESTSSGGPANTMPKTKSREVFSDQLLDANTYRGRDGGIMHVDFTAPSFDDQCSYADDIVVASLLDVSDEFMIRAADMDQYTDYFMEYTFVVDRVLKGRLAKEPKQNPNITVSENLREVDNEAGQLIKVRVCTGPSVAFFNPRPLNLELGEQVLLFLSESSMNIVNYDTGDGAYLLSSPRSIWTKVADGEFSNSAFSQSVIISDLDYLADTWVDPSTRPGSFESEAANQRRRYESGELDEATYREIIAGLEEEYAASARVLSAEEQSQWEQYMLTHMGR